MEEEGGRRRGPQVWWGGEGSPSDGAQGQAHEVGES